MKKFLRILAVIAVYAVTTFSPCIVSCALNANMPPRCNIVIADEIRAGEYLTGSIVCYDMDGLSDCYLALDNFTVRGGLFFKKAKVVSVSKPETYDGMTYTWKFVIKGNFRGNCEIILNSNSVCDKLGNGNSPVLPAKVKILPKRNLWFS